MPYGDPDRYLSEFRRMIRTTDDGGYAIDLSYFTYHYLGRPRWFSPKFHRVFGPARHPEGELTQHYKDVAAALQRRTEEVGLHLARWLRRVSGSSKVCLAGGVCLNSVMNGRILLEGIFDEVVVQPAANDAGTALGGCFWLWNTVLRNPRSYVFEHAYFGPWFEDDQLRGAIDSLIGPGDPIAWSKVDDAPERAARLLAEGKIIGWFQGRMEMGPRAPGQPVHPGRSAQAEMKDLLNARVKFRESFRPFAPSVLAERTSQWFNSGHPSPYMILVYDVLPEKRGLVPAITHVDGTGRVQSVAREHNPRYYRLIEEFERLTGVPMVLNTSFNVRGEPIVLDPRQAIECFLGTGMDALFLGDYQLTKPDGVARQLSSEQLAAAHAQAASADNQGI